MIQRKSIVGCWSSRHLEAVIVALFACWLKGSAADGLRPFPSSREVSRKLSAASGESSLKNELIKLQAETGTTVVWNTADRIQFLLFGNGSVGEMKGISIPGDALIVAISPAITRIGVLRPFPPLTRGHLEILRRDGTVVRRFPELFGGQMCWSPDDS